MTKTYWMTFPDGEKENGIGKGVYLEENTAWTLPDVDYTPYQNILSAVWPSLRHKSYNWGVLKVDVNNADTFYKDFTEVLITDPCSHPETIKCGNTSKQLTFIYGIHNFSAEHCFTLTEHLSSTADFCGVCIAQSVVFCVVFRRSLFVLISFFFCSLFWLSFDLWNLITPLESSNSSYTYTH